MGRQDYETETLVTHALRGEGFDASEDGTGRGTPLVPVAFSAKDHGADATEDLSPTLRAMPHDVSHANGGGQMAVAIPLQEIGKRTGISTDDPRTGIGIGAIGDPMFTLQAGAQHGVAYPLDLRNARRDPERRDQQNRQGLGLGEDGDPSPTISTAFVPGVAAYAFQARIARNGRGDMGDVVNALTMSGETGKGDTAPCVAITDTLGVGSNQTSGFESEVVDASLSVRRLLPEECESLQGFPRGYTRIPWKKKPAEDCPDGPRYRALGNSMAVNVMRWIGERIKAMVDTEQDGERT
jgi:DNA (cytosine-5)-methyltransferase 1